MKLLPSEKVRFACVLRSGGDYTGRSIEALYNMLNRNSNKFYEFVCLTDVLFPKEGIESISSLAEQEDVIFTTIPLENKWKGWWSVIELFRLVGPVVVTGLDTIIYDNIDKLADIALKCSENDFYMMKAWSPKRKWASGVMAWNGDWSWLTEHFRFRKHSAEYKGEQDYTSAMLQVIGANIIAIQTKFKGIYSYKHHCREKGKAPRSAKLILFHGKPRPHEVEDEWVKEIYK